MAWRQRKLSLSRNREEACFGENAETNTRDACATQQSPRAAYLSSRRNPPATGGFPRRAASQVIRLLQICLRLALCESDLSEKAFSRRSSPGKRNQLPQSLFSGPR